MKLSLNWIQDFVTLPEDLSPTEIAFDLTMATVEVEDVIDYSQLLDKVVVGIIQEITKHPDADKLSVCAVDVGGDSPEEIVCGGSNLSVGQKVAVAQIGAKVRWHGEGDLIELKPTKIRGVASHGMICASTEIGLGDLFPLGGEKEIMDISEFAVEAGQPLAKALELEDVVLDIDNKSLTNRPDLWGHYGVARELAALYARELKPLSELSFDDAGPVSVDIQAPELCRRYSATQISGVSVGPSPYKIRSRLARVGQRPINLLVDLTNYVMFTLGQPCHAFDTERVSGAIVVRKAESDESIELLDGSELKLADSELLIADDQGGIALAGVMGGARSSVFPETKDIILEFAHFDATNIRKTASRHDTRTESSTRFEKSLDPSLLPLGVSLFVTMLQEVQPGATVLGQVDDYPRPLEPTPITVTTEFLHWRLGKEIEESKIVELLERLGCSVDANDGILTVTPPSWRATGDLSLPEDLVEEVARMHGYEKFEFVPPPVLLDGSVNQPRFQMEAKVKKYLASSGGMYEVVNHPWVHERFLKAVGISPDSCLTLDSPPSPEERFIQPSLVPQLIKAVVDNLRYQKEFRLFEVNRVFHPTSDSQESEFQDSLPNQPKHLAGALVGKDAQELFRDAKGVLTGLCSVLPFKSLQFVEDTPAPWAPTGYQVAVRAEGKGIGALGVLSSSTLRKAGIKHANVVLFELNLDAMEIRGKKATKYQPLPKFERVEYDMSFLLDESVKWQDIHKLLKNADKIVLGIDFIEEYRGKNIPEGRKSIALRATLGSNKDTLTSEQIAAAAESMEKRVTDKLGGQLRSK